MIPLRDNIRSRKVPFITIILIIINVAIFLYQNSLPTRAANEFVYNWAVIPMLRYNQIWRLITAAFLHGGWGHLLGNMLYLWIFGDNIEDELGHIKFLLFYLLMAAIASAVQIVSDINSIIPVIGASGAVAGVLGAYFVTYPYSRIVTFVPLFLFRIVHIPSTVYLAVWFATQFLSGVLSDAAVASVAWWAHIGGFVAGAIIIRYFRPPKRKYFYYE
jgi:membrane associated rhomboid family serine protease